MHWSCVFLALTHRNMNGIQWISSVLKKSPCMKSQLKIIQSMPGLVKHLRLLQWSSYQSNVQIHLYMAWTPNPGKYVVMDHGWTRIQPADQLMVLSAYILIHISSWPFLHVYKESDITSSQRLPYYPIHHKYAEWSEFTMCLLICTYLYM